MSDRPKGAIVVRSAEAGRLVGFANRGTAEERRQAIKDGLKASRETEPEMSDVDRLRAAADRLDEWAVEYHRRGGGPLTLVDAWEKQSALLRAVVKVLEQEPPINWLYPVVELDAAARALADTILGVPNTGGSESGDVPYKNPADEYPREDGWGYG